MWRLFQLNGSKDKNFSPTAVKPRTKKIPDTCVQGIFSSRGSHQPLAVNGIRSTRPSKIEPELFRLRTIISMTANCDLRRSR